MQTDFLELSRRFAARPDSSLPVGGDDLLAARKLEKSSLATLQPDHTSSVIVHCTITDAGREMAKDAKVKWP